MFTNYLSLLFVSLLLISNLALADTASYIEYVYDGDTVNAHTATGEFKLRLSEIDAPELNQADGKIARRALMQLCQKDAVVAVKVTGADRYHRQLGSLQCNQTDVAKYLAEHGDAWHYAHYSHNTQLASAQINAQTHHLGLWRDPNAIPPWIWRKSHPHYGRQQ